MQCQRQALRATCRASNAYSSSRALRAAFRSTTKRDNDDQPIPSAWEPTGWEELVPNEPVKEHTQRQAGKHGQQEQQQQQQQNRVVRLKQSTRGGARGKKDPSDSLSFSRKLELVLEQVKANARAQLRVTTTDLSDPQYWRTLNRCPAVDAESWQVHMGGLVTLSHLLHEVRLGKQQVSTKERNKVKAAFDYLPSVVLPRAPEGTVLPAPSWERQPHQRKGFDLRGELLANLELEEEIARFVRFMRPTPMERIARQAAVEEVMRFVKDELAAAKSLETGVEVHGSERTGLAMPTSDIDIRIWAQDPGVNKRNKYHNAESMLRRICVIQRALRQDPERFGVVTLREGMHPILNFQHRPSGLDFQIVATDSSSSQEDATRVYLSQFDKLPDLFVIMRTFLQVRGLLPVHNGGIGSYGCFVMLLPPLLRARDPGMSTTAMLRHFFAFYDPCTAINPSRHAVACHPRQIFRKHKAGPRMAQFARSAELRGDVIRAGQWQMCQRNEYQPYLLTIQDPANPNNNLGARMHATKHIIATIARARGDLSRWEKRMREEVEYEPLISKIVGRPDILYKSQRKVLEDYGRAVNHKRFVQTTSEMSMDPLQIPKDDAADGSNGDSAEISVQKVWARGGLIHFHTAQDPEGAVAAEPAPTASNDCSIAGTGSKQDGASECAAPRLAIRKCFV